MRIYANGCSFTYGDELTNPFDSSWPTLIARKFNGTINNDAISGGTNYRTVYQTIKNTKDHYDLYLIGWTDYSRYTMYNAENNFDVNFNIQLKNKLYENSPEYKDWGRILYKHWYNELYAFKLYLQQIIQLQAVLKGKNYLMINSMHNNLDKWLADRGSFISAVKNLVNFNIMSDDQLLAEYEEINFYVDNIDYSSFYQWGSFFITQLCDKFPVGPHGHILEQGHIHVAQLLYNHLCLKLNH